MKIPENLYYTKSHEWVNIQDDTTAKVGLSDYAQDQLGDLVFVNLPEEGDEVTAGEVFGDVESVKAVSDIYAPVSGTVLSVNEALLDQPELINQDPYEAWFMVVEQITDKVELMDAKEYEAYIAGL